MQLSEPSSQSTPHIVTMIIGAIILMTPFITFQDDQLPLGLTLFFVGVGVLIWLLRRYPWPKLAPRMVTVTLLVSGISLWVSRQRYTTEVSLAWLWCGVTLFLLLHSWFNGKIRSRFLLFLLSGVTLCLTIPGWWSFFSTWQRATGWLYNANGLGGVLLWPTFVWLVLVIAGWHRRWTLPLLGLTVSTLLITISLTAFVSAIIPAGLGLWWYRRQIRWRWMFGVTAVILIVAAGIWFIWKPPRLVRLMTSQHIGFSFTQRWEFDRVALRMWQVKPLTGWGLGTYKQTFPRYTNQFDEQPLYAHNTYFQMLAETGIVGGAGWLLAVAVIGYAGWVVTRRTVDGTERTLLTGLFLGWLAFSIHAALDFSWYFPAGQVWWILSSAIFIARWRPSWMVERRWPGVVGTAVLGTALLGLATLVLLAIPPTNRGAQAVTKNDDPVAISAYDQAVQLTNNPSTITAVANVYWLRRKNDDLVVSERLLRSSIRYNADDYFLHNALGLNLIAQKRVPDAVIEFSAAYVLDPMFHPEFSYNYITALKNADRDAQALQVLNEVLRRYAAGETTNPIIAQQLPLLEQLKTQLQPAGA